MNADQGSQYTGAGWITTFPKVGIKISMGGWSRYLDNIFIEKLWWPLKREAVFLHEITDGFQAKRVIDDWIGFYNSARLTRHSTSAHQAQHTSSKQKHEKRHEHTRCILEKPQNRPKNQGHFKEIKIDCRVVLENQATLTIKFGKGPLIRVTDY